ncbi:MAG: TonB-dependent receptor [Candidatus Kapabacteria bacterium]|jgi:hypothetical protein|nr:TonB-dependent receptor [Candidatus Kapabacteria bacterium]
MNSLFKLIGSLISRLTLLILIISAASTVAAAEKSGGSLSGYVRDSKSKETLISATIFIKGTKLGAYSNKLGFYHVHDIPPGKYEILISSVGYTKISKEFTIESGKSIRHDFLLEKTEVFTESVKVMADREVERREITISKINVPISQLKEIRIGGESDVFRSLQMLPGVLSSSQISSGLYVRGGSPDQNLVLIDGAPVYNPSHLFGFISTFNSEAIKDVELIKGAYPAEYGGRLSSVLNLTQKDGDREDIGAQLSIGTISSKLSVEGPLGDGAFFLGGRRTYLELVKAAFEDPETPFPDFNFYDLNFKVTQDLTDDDKLMLSGFMSADHMAYDMRGVDMALDLGNYMLNGRYTRIFSDEAFLTANVSYSQYFNKFSVDVNGNDYLIDNKIIDYTGKVVLEWFATNDLTAKFGGEISHYDFNYLQDFSGDTEEEKTDESGGYMKMDIKDMNYAAFAQANWNSEDFYSLQGGIRIANFQEAGKTVVEPRLAVKYDIQSDLSIKLAYGVFHQNLKLATQPDFSFFDTWLPTDGTIALSRATHYIASIETKPFDEYDLNFDFYYKKMENINELNRYSFEGQTAGDVFYTGEGDSYGAEIFLQKKYGDFTGWFGYGLGYINRKFDEINDGKTFNPKYDRRHDIKLVGQYTLNKDWSFGAQFTYQTGQNYTGYTSIFRSRLPGQNYGKDKTLYSDYYGLRLPASHQLNVNATYSFTTFGLESKLHLDIYNLYNRRDIWFRYYNTNTKEYTDIELIPILPSLSFEIKY